MSRPATGQVLERCGKRGRTFAIRFRAYGKRRYVTLDVATRQEAQLELGKTIAAVKLGIWRPPEHAPLVELPAEAPTFHAFASRWVENREPEVDARTAEYWRWALTNHVLPFVGTELRVSAITVELVDRYRAEKLREREAGLVKRPLSNGSINATLKIWAQILDDAVEYGHLDANPARGKRRRLKASKPRRTWLEVDEARALIDAAGHHRALIATMILAGLRVGELAELRWRSVSLANGKLTVEDAKSDAGRREVDISPWLVDELGTHKARASFVAPADFVFATKLGTQRKRSNVSRQILEPAIKAANAKRAEGGLAPIQSGVTNHSLRRTFASLLYEAGASPAYVMAQMGRTSSALALEVYARKMERQRDTGARMDALVRGADWARMGTSDASTVAGAEIAAEAAVSGKAG